MADFRLVAARKLMWAKDVWKQPAYIGLVIQGLQEIAGDETESTEAHAEAENLMKKLYVAVKRPPLT